MSIHFENGKWRVRWRVNGRLRSATFDRKGDARRFEAEVIRRRQLGPHLVAELDRTAMTLGEFVRGPWSDHAATLSEPTRAKYRWALEKHLSPLRDEPLLSIDVGVLTHHQRLMIERGATPSTVREVMARLGGVLQIAVEQGRMPRGNPVRSMRKVKAGPTREVVALTHVELERLIARASGRDQIVYLLAGHLGLRPKEIRLVPWSAFEGSVLIVGKAHTKVTAMRTRVVTVPRVTATALREWRFRCGIPDPELPIIGELSENAMKLWGRRVLRPAVEAATQGRIKDATLYTLRHTNASLLHYCDSFTLPEAAQSLGHDGALHLKTYAHVVRAMSGKRYADLDALIRDAQASLANSDVPSKFRKETLDDANGEGLA